MAHLAGQERILPSLHEDPEMSDLDADTFAILFRNLVENVLRHSTQNGAAVVTLASDGRL